MVENTEILNVYIWILSGVLTFVIGIIMTIGTTIAKNLSSKLTTLIESVQQLILVTTEQREQIKTLFNNEQTVTKRLDDHTERLRDIEINCSKKCSNGK